MSSSENTPVIIGTAFGTIFLFVLIIVAIAAAGKIILDASYIKYSIYYSCIDNWN